MVGVPRSSGCRICVQRRVRCDGARPICNNCRKGNRPCPGYGPGVKFQDEGPRLREKFQKGQSLSASEGPSEEDYSVSLTSNSRSPSPGETPTRQWNVLGLDIEGGSVATRMNVFGFVEGKMKSYMGVNLFDDVFDSSSSTTSFDDPNFTHYLDPWAVMTREVLSPEAQQLQLLAKFTQAITPPESRFLPKAMRAQGTWLAQLPDMSGTNQLLDASIRAVTLVHIGRIRKNEVFIQESRPYYGQALRCLNNAITDKEMGMSNKTLCATILLSFYEMFASDSDSSWIRHAGGAATLMRMRGAKRHRYGLDRDIFLAYRNSLLVEALTLDTPSFLDEPEWRELSRDIYSDLLSNNMIPPDRLAIYDIAEEFWSQLAAISTVSANAVAMSRQLDKPETVQGPEIQAMCSQLQKHHTALQHLMRRWQTTMKKLGHNPPLKPVDDPVFPYQYQYTNVFVSSFYTGFRTTLMLLNAVLHPLAKALGRDNTHLAIENTEHAIDCCQSIEFMLRSSFLGPFYAIYALRFAYKVFGLIPGDIRADWALCKLVEIGDRRLMFAKAAFTVHADDLPLESPEQLYESANQRLTEFYREYKLSKDQGYDSGIGET